MNNRLTQLTGLCAAALLLLASCEKEEERAILAPKDVPGLTASATTLNLSMASASQPAVTYNWTPSTFGYDAAVTYTLQFDKQSGDFSTPYEVAVGSALTKTFTVAEINDLLISRLKLTAGSPAQVKVRVKSSVGDKVAPLNSGVSTFTATPYLVVINYPSLYVPGNYQGWTPATAPKISAFTNNPDSYEGYVNITDASPEFKFTSAPNWDNTNYGDGGTAGTLSSNGGAGNLKVTGPGYYRLKANTKSLTWENLKTTWGVIGSATPNEWNSDTPLTFDAATGTWSARVALKVGEIKFRANSDWGVNFGDGGNGAPVDAILDYGGDNIKINTAGTYTVTLDLSKPGNYTYTVK
ncbi:SusF/SusE family outer membrane protein [Hymenobacter oligotrophus]|uniref:SusF/SusE family outer membrane protein n=1 Tax=Hymenobacter oligotrophus TaxID=2319843 RepID=A0A3B7RRI9_9BACT|nr:SusE domain-containing protein [Hymenobacter oligotrophus]AYA36767.1 SusF/SusE family outer membrane protein [Hymenobacter oligotrophus]